MKWEQDAATQREVKRNRAKFFERAGIRAGRVVSADLVHGNAAASVWREHAGKRIARTDALLTNERGVFLSITVADCLPIFLFDPKKRVAGLVHGGWRSLAGGILVQTADKMKREYQTNVEDVAAYIGPGISLCHFEVREDVLGQFQSFPSAVLERGDRAFVDLKKAAFLQLRDLGVRRFNIQVDARCTFCNPELYFSHRREKGENVRAMIAVLGMR